MSKAEDPFSGRWVQSFGQRSEHHGDLVRGSFQPVEGRGAPGSERGTAGLTAKRLDALGMPMLAIADEGVNVSIGDAEVRALLASTGEALGVYPDGVLLGGFSPHSRGALVHRQVSHSAKECRLDEWRGSPVACVA